LPAPDPDPGRLSGVFKLQKIPDNAFGISGMTPPAGADRPPGHLPGFKPLKSPVRAGFFIICRIFRRFFPLTSNLEDFFSAQGVNQDKLHLFFINGQVALEKIALLAEFWHEASVSASAGWPLAGAINHDVTA